MDGLLVCAARFLASTALCRYSSDRDDMQDEHWKDDSVPQISPNRWQACCVSQLVMTRSALRCGKSRPSVPFPAVGAHIADCRIFEKVPPRFPAYWRGLICVL